MIREPPPARKAQPLPEGGCRCRWIVEGHPPIDLWDVDIRRLQPFQANSDYLVERASEALGLGYVAYPDGIDSDFVTAGTYEIEVAGERFAAEASLRPLYDPKSERVRG